MNLIQIFFEHKKVILNFLKIIENYPIVSSPSGRTQYEENNLKSHYKLSLPSLIERWNH